MDHKINEILLHFKNSKEFKAVVDEHARVVIVAFKVDQINFEHRYSINYSFINGIDTRMIPTHMRSIERNLKMRALDYFRTQILELKEWWLNE